MILVFAFFSDLRAELILPEFEKPVNTFQDISDQTLKISKLRLKGLKFSIREEVANLVEKGKVSTDIKNDNVGFEEMETLRQCRLNNRETAVDIQLKHQKNHGKTLFHISTHKFSYGFRTWDIKQGNIYREKLERTILQMTDTGLKDAIWRKYYQKQMKDYTENENEKQLDMEHGIYLALILWTMGMFLAFLCFLVEIEVCRKPITVELRIEQTFAPTLEPTKSMIIHDDMIQ